MHEGTGNFVYLNIQNVNRKKKKLGKRQREKAKKNNYFQLRFLLSKEYYIFHLIFFSFRTNLKKSIFFFQNPTK